MLEAVLSAAPQATGVLFDQPHVVNDPVVKASARMKLQGGDFFKDVLPVCDAYLIMQVIHDWSDDQALEILKAIRRSAPPQAKLLLIEAIVPDNAHPSWIKMLDIGMLTILQRTFSRMTNDPSCTPTKYVRSKALVTITEGQNTGPRYRRVSML